MASKSTGQNPSWKDVLKVNDEADPMQKGQRNKYRVRYALAYFFIALAFVFTLFAALCCIINPLMIPAVVCTAILLFFLFKIVNSNRKRGGHPFSQEWAKGTKLEEWDEKLFGESRRKMDAEREQRAAERERRKGLTPEERAAERKERKRQKFYSYGPALCVHSSGLPLGEGVECALHSEEGKITITSGIQTFVLEKKPYLFYAGTPQHAA